MDAASPFWKELTQEQKDSYNDLAKAREPKINIIRTTYTSFGESVQENEAKKKIEAEGYEAMLDEINLMIDESDESGSKLGQLRILKSMTYKISFFKILTT